MAVILPKKYKCSNKRCGKMFYPQFSPAAKNSKGNINETRCGKCSKLSRSLRRYNRVILQIKKPKVQIEERQTRFARKLKKFLPNIDMSCQHSFEETFRNRICCENCGLYGWIGDLEKQIGHQIPEESIKRKPKAISVTGEFTNPFE